MPVKRPARLRYAIALPLVLLCAALVLFGTYRGFLGGADAPDVATEPTANSSEGSTADLPLQESAEPQTESSTVADEQQSPELPTKAVVMENPKKNPETARKTVAEPKVDDESAAERAPVRSAETRQQTRRSNGETRPRRVVRPAFEQPSVSSIEAIMTGVPYERRRRWEEDTWTEDELRRRRMRRMRRQQRMQQPY